MYSTLLRKASKGIRWRKYADMHGYSINEIKEMDLTELEVNKAHIYAENEEIKKWVSGGEVVRFEIEHYHKDGHVFPLSITLCRIRIETPFFLLFYQDITERKKAEAEVQKRMEDLEWFNNVSVGRELKMVDLKMEVNNLLLKLGEQTKYEIYS